MYNRFYMRNGTFIAYRTQFCDSEPAFEFEAIKLNCHAMDIKHD
jgi:hypothetical protein